MKIKIVLLLFLTLTLTSCGVYQDTNESEIEKMKERFMDRHRQEVIINGGIHDEISRAEEGGELTTYRRLN